VEYMQNSKPILYVSTISKTMLTAGALACSGAVFGATTFSDDFTGGASANWENPAAADYTSDTAAFTGVGNNGRIFLRTQDADYNGVDFTATVDLARGNAGDGSGSTFFGIGSGDQTPGGAAPWGEPASGEYIYLRIRGNAWTSEFADINSNGGGTTVYGLPHSSLAADAFLPVQLSYVAATSTATFTLDTDGNGFDGSDPAVTHSNTNLSPTASRVFFGGNAATGSGSSAGDNFSITVVPEPTAAVLGALATLAFFRRRRA